MRIILGLFLLLLLPALLSAQRKVEAETIHATQTLSIRKNADRHNFTGAEDTITVASTHAQIPTAKAVWDLLDGLGGGADGNGLLDGSGTFPPNTLGGIGSTDAYFGVTYFSGDTAMLAYDRTSHGYVLLKSKNQTTTLRVANDSIRAVSSGLIRLQAGTDLSLRATDLATLHGNQVSISAAGSAGNTAQILRAQGDDTAQWEDFSVGATLEGNGTFGDPLQLAQQGATSGQVLKWNGSAWLPANDTDTGDDWGAQAVETDATLDGDGTPGDPLGIAQQGATSGQVLKWNGSAWLPAADTDTGDDWGAQAVETDATLVGDGTPGDPLGWFGAYVDGPLTGNGLNATPIDVLNLGITEQYIGAAAVTSSKIRDTTIVTQDIKDAAVTGAKIAQAGATSGQALKWNGTTWEPADDSGITGSGASGQVTYWNGASTVTGSNSLFWDAANARLGLNTTTPARTLSILSSSGTTPNIQVVSDGTIDQGVRLFEMVGTATGPYVQRGRIDMDVYSALGSIPDGHSINFVLARDGGSTYTAMALYNNQAIFNRSGSFTLANNTAELRLAPNTASQIRMYHAVLIAGSAYGTADTTNRLRVEGRTQTSATNSAVFNDGGAQRILTIRDDRRVGILTSSPARALHVAGEVRITDLATDDPTGIVGADADGDLGAITVGSGLSLTSGTLSATGAGVTDHGALTGLSDDDHTQYALLAGRAGGQTLTGGTASGENLTLSATSHATKGAVLIGTDGSKSVLGTSVYYRGDITPSALSANTDDWNPSGLDTVSTLRISATSAVNLTGIQGGADGRFLYIYNIGEYTITLKDNTTSSSSNRFDFDTDIELKHGQGIILQYNSSASKWYAAGSTTWARSAVVYTYTTEQTNTALTVPAGAKTVDILCLGGGGGGGGGRRGAAGTIRSGGSGGQAGYVSFNSFSLAGDLASPSTLYVNCGGAGTAGAGAAADDTNGGDGGDGGDSDVRLSTSSADRFIFAGGGNNGVGGDADGSSASSFNTNLGMFGGSGGGSSSATGGNGTTTSVSTYATGGGGGGGVNTSNTAGNGGSSASACMALYSSASGGAGGATGTNGTTRTQVTGRLYGAGGGGGGGGSAGTGGNGGNGILGGGGGGGGGSLNGNNSGAGGSGGPGMVRLIFYF